MEGSSSAAPAPSRGTCERSLGPEGERRRTEQFGQAVELFGTQPVQDQLAGSLGLVVAGDQHRGGLVADLLAGQGGGEDWRRPVQMARATQGKRRST